MDKNKNNETIENIRNEHGSVMERFKLFDTCEDVIVNHKNIPVVAQWVSILTVVVFTISA